MKLLNIYPINNLQEYEKQDFNMFLTHLVLDYPEYEEIARTNKGYKILDNSLIEVGEAMSFDLVLKAAELINADEVVLPDKFIDGPTTVKYVEETLKRYKQEMTSYKTMAVVHGNDLDEVSRTWLSFINNPQIDVLGIPKVWTKQFGNRSEILNIMINLYGTQGKEIHLLGLWDDFRELRDLNFVEDIRSIDTSLAVLYDYMRMHLGYVRDDNERIDLEQHKVLSNKVAQEARRYVEGLE